MRKPAPVSARPMHMMVSRRRPTLRTTLTASALAAVLLATLSACGEEATPTAGSPTASDTPSETPTQEPTETPTASPFDPSSISLTGDADATLVDVLAASDAGGDLSGIAMSVEGQMAVDDFVSPLAEPLASEVRDAVAGADAPPSTSLWAAVAHVGCEAPASISITPGEAGFEVTAEPAKETVECLVPVTYLVVFAA